MKITYLSPLSCGNAIRLVVQPTLGEKRWRVLRKEVDDFSGQDDPSAFVVHDGGESFLTDSRLIVNGVAYFYVAYGLDAAGVWWGSGVRSAVPQATFTDLGIDVQEIVRERIEVTLASMIERSMVVVSQPSIPVMSIPFYTQGGALPVVTVLYGGGSSVVRGVGELMSDDDDLGWVTAVTLEISLWTLNAQERNALRRALETAIAANLGVFEDQGIMLPEVQAVQDMEDTQSMNAPIYQTVIRFGCQVATAVTDEYGVISDVISTILEE